MKIGIISLFPTMFTALEEGITGKAIRNKLLDISHWNPRDFTHDPRQTVDDRPYGGGPGMVMMFTPLYDSIQAAKTSLGEHTLVIHLSPQGQRLTQESVATLAQHQSLIILTSRYEGVDERLLEVAVDQEWSVGDYVVSGGEIPAMLLIDAITRLLPGALGHDESAAQDSFSNGLLDFPHYTRPATIGNLHVPDVLLSGNHADILRFRQKQSLGRTWQRRPDLIKQRHLTSYEQLLLEEFINEQN